MDERAAEFAQVVADETGGTFGWGMFNVGLATGMLREAGVHAAAVHDQEIHSHIPGKRMRAVRQPAGVVVGIAPWNAPVILGTRAVAAPLAYGNTVVMKASEAVSANARADRRVPRSRRACPRASSNLITNAPADAAEVVEALIAHPDVRRINFTGSSHVGRIIAEKAGRHLKRVVLELGGKAPFVVLEDADLDAAAAAANFGAFMHQGQICMSTERIVVDRRVAEQFAEKLAARASTLKVGDPRDPSTQIGPLINAGALDRVSELVEDAVDKGAQLLTGGEADGLVYRPTVLRGVTPEMRIYSEESFGPSVSIIEVDGAEEAISVANDTEYGLSASIFSRDVERARAAGAPDPERHLPHQRRDRARRAAGAVRRRQGERLGSLRRRMGRRGVHRAALDHDPGRAARISDLTLSSCDHRWGAAVRGAHSLGAQPRRSRP